MAKQGWLAISICIFLASTLFYAGCNNSDSSNNIQISKGKNAENDADSPSGTQPLDPGQNSNVNPLAPKPLLKDWANPALALLISGEMSGYLEPCGCSETQSGGLARRADLYRQMTEDRGWSVVGLELGGTVKAERASRVQSHLKFQTIVDALNELNYQAMGIGLEEIKLEESQSFFLLSKSNPDPENSPGLSIISANIRFPEDQAGFPSTHRVIQQNEQTLFVTSILSETYWKELYPQGANTKLKYVDPRTALQELIPQLEAAQPDLAVLLSYATIEESRELAKAFPQFRVVVSTGTDEPLIEGKEMIGESMLLTLGKKGKHVAVVGLTPGEPIQSEVIDLDQNRFETAPSMVDHMRQYQAMIEAEQLAMTEPPIPHPNKPYADYVGAEKCGTCHKQAYAKWSTSKHAHAFHSLETGREGQDPKYVVSRINDPECLACHVTGWSPQQALRYQGGYQSPQKSPHLMGQQCENCHGPGSEHVKLELQFKQGPNPNLEEMVNTERESVRLKKEVARKELCIKCHDYENDPDFNFDQYWPKIEHPWKY